jgi:CBS domain-containing protein/ribosome-associated translation inhibitor RaiA
MELGKILGPALVFGPDEKVSHVATKMLEKKACEAVVMDEEFMGIVTADDMVKRSVSDPSKVKISYFLKNVRLLTANTPAEDIINYMLVSNYRTLPVKHDGKIFSVRKSDLLGFVKDEVFEGKKARDVMQFPYCIERDESINTAKSIMKDLGLTRLPVVDGGEVVGFLDVVSMLRTLTDKGRARLGERDGEKLRPDVNVSAFMEKDVFSVKPETDLKDVVKEMSKGGLSIVFVEENGKLSGIITVKDILKLIGRSLETVYIRITGLGGEDEFIKSKIDEMVNNSIEKLIKSVAVNYVVINVETHKIEGKRKKYSVQGRFVTDKGSFYASDYGWDPTKAMKSFLEKIEREVHKKIEKERGY